MDRRGLLLGAGAACMAGPVFADALPVPRSDEIAFKIFHNGSPVGEHRLNFTRDGDDLMVATAVKASGRLAGIIPFTYQASIMERWSGGKLQTLGSKVNYDGTMLEVHALKVANGIQVEGTHVPRYIAPPNTLPLTYWNKALLDGPMLNIQTAHTTIVRVQSAGWNRLPTANDGTIIAQQFDVIGKLHFKIWYDVANQWAGLEMHVFGTETYEKIV